MKLPDNTSNVPFHYDLDGNLQTFTTPNPSTNPLPTHTLSSNSLGLLQTYTPPADPNSGATNYSYDRDRRMLTNARPDGTVSSTFDFAGRRSVVSVPTSTSTYSYDSSDRLTTLTMLLGKPKLTFGYDDSLLTSTAWSQGVGGTVSQTYDSFFRVSSQTTAGAQSGTNTVNFTYDEGGLVDAAGTMTLKHDPLGNMNGLLASIAIGSETDSWTYNGFGELATYTANYPGGTYTVTYDGTVARDNDGRVLEKVETIGSPSVQTTYDYTYWPNGGLNTVRKNGSLISTYTYDGNGNRTGNTVDAEDRLTVSGTHHYGYTTNGDLSSLSIPLLGYTWAYSYDLLGNLQSVTLPSGAGTISYVVDGLNRRIQKSNSHYTQRFFYDSKNRVVAELDGSNNLVSTFVYATKANVPDYMLRGGNTYRLISDQLGSVRLVVNVSSSSGNP